MERRALIIGAGDWMCGDEAAGIMAAHEVGRRIGEAAQVSYDAGLIDGLLTTPHERLPDIVVFVATAKSRAGGVPGTVVSRDFRCAAVTQPRARLFEPYADRLARLGGELRRTSTHLWGYAVVGRDFNLGSPLSSAVRGVLRDMVVQIEANIRRAIQPSPIAAPVRMA